MENLEFCEKPKFIFKDYGIAMYIKLYFLLACFIFIYIFFHNNSHSVFFARVIADGILFAVAIAFFVLFQRKLTIDFYDDRVEFSEILSIKKEKIILSEIPADEIVIRPYNFYSFNTIKNPIGKKETVGPFKVTIGKNDIRLYTLSSCFLYILTLPFILFLRLIRQIKDIKFDMLNIGKFSIPLSELSPYEFSQLNNYLKEKFGLEIKDIRKINFKGETLC